MPTLEDEVKERKHEAKIEISRVSLNDKAYKDMYGVTTLRKRNLLLNLKNYAKKYVVPSRKCGLEFLFEHLPFIKLIKTYKAKYIVRDLIGGITIGAMQIAPTMANSVMANLPPINGLYVAFFAVMMYVLFGTSRHLSLGTHGAISLMVGSIIARYEGTLYPMKDFDIHNQIADTNITRYGAQFLSDDPVQAKIMIAMCLAFMVGLIQILFSLFYGGVITKYLSDMVIDAFTISSSLVIVISQINILLGYDIKNENIPFKLLNIIIGTAKRINMINWATFVISIITVTILYVVKRFINEKYKKKLKIPVPIELIVIIFATLFSYIWNFEKRWHVDIVGTIPLGVPKPRIPPLKLFPLLIGDAFTIALVSFALNISMAKYFSKKHHYEINSNQELLSYGMGNVACSLFGGLPAGGGLTRSLIMESTGAQTQVFSIISSGIVLIVIVGLGFLFESLPHTCLAAIIATSLLHKCFEIKKIIPIFKKSKVEALVWMSTFCGTIILDVNYGLYFGIGASILMVIVQDQRAYAAVLGQIEETELYEDIGICDKATELKDMKIIRYEASVYYANVEHFTYSIVKLSGFNPTKLANSIDKAIEKSEKKIEKLKHQADKLIKPHRSIFDYLSMQKNGHQKAIENKIGDIKLEQAVVDQNQVNLECVKVDDGLKSLKADTENFEEMIERKNLKNKIDSILRGVTIKYLIIDMGCISTIDTMGMNAILHLSGIFKKVGVQLYLTDIKSSVGRILAKSSFDKKFSTEFIYPTIHDAVTSLISETNILSSNQLVSDADAAAVV